MFSDASSKMNNLFSVNEKLLETAQKAEELCKTQFCEIDRNAYINGQKVLN